MGNQFKTAGLNDTDNAEYDTKYPKLAKKSSDGTYSYLVQRRLSAHITGFCVRRGISTNAATRIDFILALLAALFLYLGYSITAVVFIQLFGIWSCVDGEIARLTKSTSRLGDFYDTMVDRTAEFLIVGALMLSMHKAWPDVSWGAIFFAYMGSVFLITASSEKFRSVFHENYPKNSAEPFFCWLCAGSDTRLFYLSLGIIAYAISGYATFIQWLIIIQSVLLGFNFMFRLWKIPNLMAS
ncbi:MAG: CDP-alcohol phosphatidyltransferase family protein [Deltaproteobacteria bacterium]|nr:CDP-alcohol phosphatidyltransferase family protein [Deltaproteobacteria bacterium]